MLSKDLLNDLQEFVDSHICVLNTCIFEDFMLSESRPCEYIERDEMKDFIKSNKKP